MSKLNQSFVVKRETLAEKYKIKRNKLIRNNNMMRRAWCNINPPSKLTGKDIIVSKDFYSDIFIIQ